MNHTTFNDEDTDYYVKVLTSGKKGQVLVLYEDPDTESVKNVPESEVQMVLKRTRRWKSKANVSEAELLMKQYFRHHNPPAGPSEEERRPQKPIGVDRTGHPVWS